MNQKINIKQLENKNSIIAENFFDKETLKGLLKSEEDIEKGRIRKAVQVLKEFEKKYGF